MSDAKIRVRSKLLAEEWRRLLEESEEDEDYDPVETAREALAQFDDGSDSLQYELLERPFLIDPVIKVRDPSTGRFCMIPAGDEPTRIESPGKKKYLYMVEVTVTHPVEVEAEDELDAHDQAFTQLEALQLGDCEELTLSFHNVLDDAEGGFSPN